jgi:hypothetical protein
MNAVIKTIEATGPTFQDRGTVVAIEGEDIVVHSKDGRFHARRAVSCLVEPAVDDEVLIAGWPSGELYILAILERPDDTSTRVNAPGDVTFQVANGSFTVVAARGVNVVSADDIQLTSTKAFQIKAAEGQVFIERLAYLGQRAFAEISQAKMLVGALETVADRILQRVKRSYKFVEELDQVRAEYIDQAAEKNLRIRGENALVNAKKLVKLDAEQIHMG